MSRRSFRQLLVVEAEADPQVPARILGTVTQRNVLPSWFSARRIDEDQLRVIMELGDLDEDRVRYIVQCILKIPTVVSVVAQPMSAGSRPIL